MVNLLVFIHIKQLQTQKYSWTDEKTLRPSIARHSHTLTKERALLTSTYRYDLGKDAHFGAINRSFFKKNKWRNYTVQKILPGV